MMLTCAAYSDGSSQELSTGQLTVFGASCIFVPAKSVYMLLNESTAIVTPKIILVPYRREHVEKYNQWMQSAELRELTASEPLTLAQEFEMQESWRNDNDKLTFVILARTATNKEYDPLAIAKSEIDSLPMIGDVNIFLKQSSYGDDEVEAEVEVMIAEPAYRRQGLASCAVSALLHYVTTQEVYTVPSQETHSVEYAEKRRVAPSMLVARIAHSNLPSISLFQKLGFTITKEANIFGEIEMRFSEADMEQHNRWGEAGTETQYPFT